MKIKTFKEKTPIEKTWIKVIYNGVEENDTVYGSSGWEYFYCIGEHGLPLFANNENLDYIFPAGEDGITHWYDK